VNLCIDLEYVVRTYWPGGAFECLRSIEIMPSCLVRWLFAAVTPLRPDASGVDLPNKFKLMAGIKCATMLIAEDESPAARRQARDSLFSQGGKRKSERVTPGKRAMTALRKDEFEFSDDFIDDEELGETTAEPPPVDARGARPENEENEENEERELELVYIEARRCYYCPDDQQYYQIDE